MSPPLRKFFTPSGKLERSRVISTFTALLPRGLGFQEYHSLIGATKLCATPCMVGCAVSSIFTRAGSEGQLLAPKLTPPMKSLNQVQLLGPKPETWKPSQAPPRSM